MSRVLEALRQLHLIPNAGTEMPQAKVKPRLSAFVRQSLLVGAKQALLFACDVEPATTEPTVLFQVPRLTIPTLLEPPALAPAENVMQPNEPQPPANENPPATSYALQAESPDRVEKSLDQITASLLAAFAEQSPETSQPTADNPSTPPLIRALPRMPATPFELNLRAHPLDQDEEQAFRELAETMRAATRTIPLPLLALASLGAQATSQAALLRLSLRFAEEYGRPALLVDAAFASSPLSVALEREQNHGLSEVLSGNQRFDELLQATSFPNVDFLPVGRSISNAYAFALNSADFAEQLRGLEDRYAVILCDVGGLRHPWAVAVARAADAAYLAVELGGTPMEEAVECIGRFRESGGEFNGCVVLGSE